MLSKRNLVLEMFYRQMYHYRTNIQTNLQYQRKKKRDARVVLQKLINFQENDLLVRNPKLLKLEMKIFYVQY